MKPAKKELSPLHTVLLLSRDGLSVPVDSSDIGDACLEAVRRKLAVSVSSSLHVFKYRLTEAGKAELRRLGGPGLRLVASNGRILG